jgi:proteic killer suppression protein
MIRSFGDDLTEDLYHGNSTRRTRQVDPALVKSTLRKLDMIEAAQALDDLRSPPGNRLEALKGELDGWFSIRINDQWRLMFRWVENGAEDVRLVDYH